MHVREVRHINLSDPDGQVYCCLRNRVVKLDDEQKQAFCSGCRMYAGEASGKGVECVWEDLRPVSDPHVVRDPYAELTSNQKRQIWPTDHLSTCMVFGG